MFFAQRLQKNFFTSILMGQSGNRKQDYLFIFMKWGLASSAGSGVPRVCGRSWVGSCTPANSPMGFGHEIISRAILPLKLFRVGQLSITGQKMYTKYWFIS